ncbi:fumarylacetoacetate hydrolase family protein [Muricoccus vinaceus]|uniref:Fumarylacetoacetate hydrolase family protein n=1 Tax=Muricoccus vinaceus TaxID=424704 RepID=A0ABV6IU94_9PROT
MKLVRFDGGRIGVHDGTLVHDIGEALGGDDRGAFPPVAMVRLIAAFDRLRPDIEALLASGRALSVPAASAGLLAPLPWPNKLMAYPVNYIDHAKEMNSTGYAHVQGYFLKANSSLSGPGEPIVLPALPGREIHHECELALVIGREGRDIPAERAREHIFGLSCLMDITIRGPEERVFRKSYDSFTPMGPWIITMDEVRGIDSLGMKLWVNGELRQSANTRDLLVGIEEMIVVASSASTLYPGDIIATGTPAGVGPIRGGDTVVIEIEQVGRMSLPVVQGKGGANRVFLRPPAGA